MLDDVITNKNKNVIEKGIKRKYIERKGIVLFYFNPNPFLFPDKEDIINNQAHTTSKGKK